MFVFDVVSSKTVAQISENGKNAQSVETNFVGSN